MEPYGDNLKVTGTCDHQSGLKKREKPTPDARWCGEWWDCPVCGYSRLIPSDDLKAQLAEQQLSIDRGQYRLSIRQ